MYFFLTQVSFCDILLTTSILPNVLLLILHEGATMSYHICFIQFFFFAMSEASESLLLTVMSYDRYVAICNPLRYNAIMDQSFCVVSSLMSWILGIVLILVEVISVRQLIICRPVVLDHFFCDFEPLLEHSCSDTSIASYSIVLAASVGLVFPFIIIVVSYVHVILSIYAIPSKIEARKAFSTCGSHLTVVSMFYGTLVSVYVVPANEKLLYIKKMLAVFYTMVIPFLNPIIYSLRNKDIKKSLDKISFKGLCRQSV
ncbi:olfactory receptor 1M1-like [Gastrophryne carolinensis]